MVAKWKKVDFKASAQLASMVAVVEKYARGKEKFTADVEGYSNPDGTYTIFVESPRHFHWDLPDLFKNDKHFHLISTERKEGTYDWASGVYMKDCDMMHFELKP